ncbi:esterase-like activity of phytase family protein [Phaeovulum sp.]|uniref:esterase-like activity of phytase family protein n=1 Tax=Phaeovulum sp. TaxID=2934796 RepID=UPI0039E4DFFD
MTNPLTRILCGAALFAPQLALAQTAPLQIEVLDTLVLGEPRVDGLKIAELSGLAYDQQNKLLYAVSDKGRIFSFSLDLTGDRIAGLTPLSGHQLRDSSGNEIRYSGFNAEGIALADDGTLSIVSEHGPRIARFSADGTWLADLAVPAAVSDPAAQRSEKDGLESLAHHPELGLMTAPEEPLAAQPRTTQTIHAASGEEFSYDTAEIGTTSIKSLEALPDGRLMILERDVAATDGSLIPWLRVLDPANCTAGQLCTTQVARIDLPNISDADFEGLAQLSDDLFLIVSDDKIGKDHRSVFALLRVNTAPKGQSSDTPPAQ